MTFCVENETEKELPFDVEEIAGKVMEAALEQEGCPYEASIELLLTDNEGIHAMNREFRNIDRPTDVLSFPNVDYEAPADFEGIEDSVEDYFDPETGEPVKGVTRQGYSDDSAWARGQAWGIYGIALNYRNSGIEEAFDLFKGMTNYFLNRLPQDNVCYWDLIFGDGSGQSRDSSAAAVAVCGMQEMCKYLPETDEDKEVYKYAMHTILRSLIENYANHSHKPGEALLLHGVYSWHSGKGIDVGNIWGDYYYVEALVRFLKDWQVWW